MAKKKTNDQPVRFTDLPAELSERGREIWLAGLGALARVEEEGEKIFKNLVERGEEFEGRGRKQIESALEEISDQQKRATKTFGDVTKGFTDAAESVERAVSNTVTDTLGRMGIPRRDEVEELSGKVGQLSEKLDALQAMLEAQQKEAKTTVYHVIPHEEGWAVKREGAERATSVHDTKKEAVSSGRDTAKNHLPSRLIVHKQDRSVQETYAYDEDE
jgi:poly(hydroxyalkanoate) granule-associated protein